MLSAHLRLLADETRLRLLHLLAEEPLTVAELQEVLDLGQSSISGHLAKLKSAGLIHDLPEGSARRYRVRDDVEASLAATWDQVHRLSAAEPQYADDRARLEQHRQQRNTTWVDRVAGSLHREYAPGRTWESLCQGVLQFARFGRCLDVGAGDGAMVELLAPRSAHLTCIDPSPRMVRAGDEHVRRLGFSNVTYLQGDGERLTLKDASQDSVLFVQSLQYTTDPGAALAEAARVLAPRGRLLVLTLASHQHDEADRFGHRHHGFAPEQLRRWCQALTEIEIHPLVPEARPPRFQTLLLTAEKR